MLSIVAPDTFEIYFILSLSLWLAVLYMETQWDNKLLDRDKRSPTHPTQEQNLKLEGNVVILHLFVSLRVVVCVLEVILLSLRGNVMCHCGCQVHRLAWWYTDDAMVMFSLNSMLFSPALIHRLSGNDECGWCWSRWEGCSCSTHVWQTATAQSEDSGNCGFPSLPPSDNIAWKDLIKCMLFLKADDVTLFLQKESGLWLPRHTVDVWWGTNILPY